MPNILRGAANRLIRDELKKEFDKWRKQRAAKKTTNKKK
jgi:hypothetical protein